MFDRYVRLAQARKARREGHFDEVLRLLEDPGIREHRRAVELREAALAGLLERAQRRAEAGAFEDALVDCERVLAVRPGDPAAVDRRRAIEDARRGADEARGRGAQRIRELDEALAKGQTRTAAGMLEAVAAAMPADDVRATRARIDARIERGRAAREASGAALDTGRVRLALDELSRARSLDAESGSAADVALLERLIPALADDWAAHIERDGAAAVWRETEAACTRLPELASAPAFRDLRRRLRQTVRQRVFELLRDGRFDQVEVELRALDRAGYVPDDADDQLIGMARDALLHRDGADPSAAVAAFERIAAECRSSNARASAERWRAVAADCDAALLRARAASAEGRALEARGILAELLEQAPRHPVARALLERVDQNLCDRDEQLGMARTALAEGRLEAASRTLLALAVPGADGEPARVLLRDVQRRIEQVERGVRDVMLRLHGRESGHRDGLVACAERLEALRAEHADHPDVARLLAAVRAEIDGLDLLGAALEACDRDDQDRCEAALSEVRARVGALLTAERLDARRQSVVDRVAAAAETALDRGRPHRARRWAAVVADEPAVANRVATIRSRADAQLADARAALAQAREALDARDLGAAEAALERAREVAGDDDDVRRLEHEHRRLASRSRELDSVEDLAAGDDAGAAAARLGRMGPTPAMLRTRIYDLKRDIVRRQGLGETFLLRVDEGGEFLVFRGEAVSIGNLRDRRADLPVLANLSGVHARLCRTLTFHGGQRDCVRGEGGPVTVGGEPIAEAALQDGARVRLGERLELEYRMPSSRSLTASLRLRGGFQIAGTERLLWMKDRGRDGRILIGASRDAHVPVESASGEVEVFADRDGQIRVACRDGGTIDGQPFRDEHPVDAGSVVSAAGLTFVLTSWQA